MQSHPPSEKNVSIEHTSNEGSIATAKETYGPIVFHFSNGDIYDGKFLSKKEKQKIVMHGRGTYRTADNHVYEGFWENDYLVAGTVIFPDKSSFTGHFRDMHLEGFGSYKFKENVEIKGELEDDRFVGKVLLVDPNQHFWRAEVRRHDTQCFFYPLHSFWQSVLSLSYSAQQYYGEEAEESLYSDY